MNGLCSVCVQHWFVNPLKAGQYLLAHRRCSKRFVGTNFWVIHFSPSLKPIMQFSIVEHSEVTMDCIDFLTNCRTHLFSHLIKIYGGLTLSQTLTLNKGQGAKVQTWSQTACVWILAPTLTRWMTSGRSSHLSCKVEVITVSPLKGWCEDYINCFIYTMRRPCVGISCSWRGCGVGGYSKEQGQACCETNAPAQVGITTSPSLGSHWNLLSWGKGQWRLSAVFFLPLPRPENLIQRIQQQSPKAPL